MVGPYNIVSGPPGNVHVSLDSVASLLIALLSGSFQSMLRLKILPALETPCSREQLNDTGPSVVLVRPGGGSRDRSRTLL
jgi:hypothetical protein